MKKYILFIILIPFAGVGLAEDLPTAAIPVAQIEKCLPDKWTIESVNTTNTVSGWTKLNGSKGVRVIISRAPYDSPKYSAKSGELAVPAPMFYVEIFPTDFEGKNINTSAIFRKGKITDSMSPFFANRSMLVMDEFTPFLGWYIFYPSVSFPDWKTPVTDIIQEIKKAPYLKPLQEMRAAKIQTEKDAVTAVVKQITFDLEAGLPVTYKPTVKLFFTLGWDMPTFGQQGDRIWQVHVTELSGPTMRIAWVNAENENVLFLFEKESDFKIKTP